MNLPEVPNELFLNKHADSAFSQSKADRRLVKIIEEVKDENGNPVLDEKGNPKQRIEYPETGGVFTYHVSFPYPEKGIKDAYMMLSIQFVKRMLLHWVRFLSFALSHFYSPIKILERFLKEFNDYVDMVDSYGRHFVLEPRYYTVQGRELIKFISSFLKYLGISEELSNRTGLIAVALVDNDTAYYYKLCDISGTADKERMLKNPGKEVTFLMETYAKRELYRPRMTENFRYFYKFIYFGLFIPRVRKAFKRATQEMDFTKLGLDESDLYHVRHNPTYNYFGMTLAERIKAGLAEYPPTQHTLIELKWNENI